MLIVKIDFNFIENMMKFILVFIQASDIIIRIMQILNLLSKVLKSTSFELQEFRMDNDDKKKDISKIKSCFSKFFCIFTIGSSTLFFISVLYNIFIIYLIVLYLWRFLYQFIILYIQAT